MEIRFRICRYTGEIASRPPLPVGLNQELHKLRVTEVHCTGVMLVERTDLPHFLLTQSEVEDVQVLYHALAAHGLGDDHHIPLVQPAQDDGRRCPPSCRAGRQWL